MDTAVDKLGNFIKEGDTVAWAVTRYRSGFLRFGRVQGVTPEGGVVVVYDTEHHKGRIATHRAKDVIKVATVTEGKTLVDNRYLAQLEDDSLKLSCLEAGGVDNWEWYSESLEEWRKAQDD